ncbi:MAG TPA: type IV pilin-like G/H family protein [Allocoleopsis sp.]
MNTDLKFKLLQYVNHQKKASGFTVVVFLIVIIVLGILVAIALPSLLDSSTKGKQSEARTYIGTINKGEQAYYTEKEKFSSSIDELGVGIKTSTINYNYHVKVINKDTKKAIVIGYSTLTPTGEAHVKPKNSLVRRPPLKNYVGFVSLIPSKDNPKDFTSSAILCEQKTGGVPLSFDIEWKPGIESPKCNSSQVQIGGTN